MEDNLKSINWFPGHMAKAIREIKEKINVVDMVIELCDARAFKSSINPIIEEIIGNKFYLKVFSKVDLADDIKTKRIKEFYEAKNINVLLANLNEKSVASEIKNMILKVAKPLKDKDIKRGLKPRNVRVMVLGIPNVGKSTLINLLSKRKGAGVANHPGFTKAQKLIVCDGFDLLDTPGILWPNLKDQNAGIKLALIGCIKEEILPTLDLVNYALNYLNANYQSLLYNKYNIRFEDTNSYLNEFATNYAHLLKDAKPDIIRSALVILNDLKNGRIGKISFEDVED